MSITTDNVCRCSTKTVQELKTKFKPHVDVSNQINHCTADRADGKVCLVIPD